MRSEHSLLKTGIFTNKHLNYAALMSVILVMLVLFTPIRSVFGLILLPGSAYLYGTLLLLSPVVVMEASKAFGLIKHSH